MIFLVLEDIPITSFWSLTLPFPSQGHNVSFPFGHGSSSSPFLAFLCFCAVFSRVWWLSLASLMLALFSSPTFFFQSFSPTAWANTCFLCSSLIGERSMSIPVSFGWMDAYPATLDGSSLFPWLIAPYFFSTTRLDFYSRSTFFTVTIGSAFGALLTLFLLN